ncbi:MAG: hypothetical protein IPP71_23505 [Bacteroidetes bacterium]|nr:hypothetical protein [Bacteroidota bacterium]
MRFPKVPIYMVQPFLLQVNTPVCSSKIIFQIDTDNFGRRHSGYLTTVLYRLTPIVVQPFWNMYLAANGKIYVTSGSSVHHLHEINYPDSAGIASDVQQHSIFLGYAQLRAVPNHPNYYLGCDACLCLLNN